MKDWHAPLAAKVFGAVGPRLDQNARPAGPLEIVGLRIFVRVGGANIDKCAAVAFAKEFGDAAFLVFRSEDCAHGLSTVFRGQPFSDSTDDFKKDLRFRQTLLGSQRIGCRRAA